MAQVAVASSEQTRGIGQIKNAVSETGSVTQANAATAEESAAAAQELSAQGLMMKHSVVELLKLGGGQQAGASDPAPARSLSSNPPPAQPAGSIAGNGHPASQQTATRRRGEIPRRSDRGNF